MASLVNNLDAFTRALGVENAPAVVWLSMHPWDSDEDRDRFIATLTKGNAK